MSLNIIDSIEILPMTIYSSTINHGNNNHSRVLTMSVMKMDCHNNYKFNLSDKLNTYDIQFFIDFNPWIDYGYESIYNINGFNLISSVNITSSNGVNFLKEEAFHSFKSMFLNAESSKKILESFFVNSNYLHYTNVWEAITLGKPWRIYTVGESLDLDEHYELDGGEIVCYGKWYDKFHNPRNLSEIDYLAVLNMELNIQPHMWLSAYTGSSLYDIILNRQTLLSIVTKNTAVFTGYKIKRLLTD
jgi:hypothetical protein